MVFFQVDQSIVDYWKDQNLTEDDFYCRECGELLLNIDELNDVKFVQHAKNGKLLTHPSFKNCKTGKKYIESPHNRWCVVGRKLSNKVFFRKICWKCFFTKLVQTIDVARKARKSSWYDKILSGNYVPPPTWVSPSSYFKLLFDISDDELFALHVKRWRRIFTVAVKNGCTTLILGAFGCGAFRNNPEIVAKAAKKIVDEFNGYFNCIEFAVACKDDWTNFEAFKKVIP